MDEIFGYMDGRFEVSLAGSTMMWIVHRAMNRAQEKMKTKTGVIERLNEISKFYELAVMQLEGCLSIVLAETETSFLESKHEEVLNDLREIKDRLQWRLKESELAMLEKDRELTKRLENELQLRQALEVKERELVALGANHTIETSNFHAENDETKRTVHGDGDFRDLRTSVDQQMMNIRQGLEAPQHDNMLGEVAYSVNDRKKIEEIGSDIDMLKESIDLAFGKMQSALFMCEMGPKERQWKLTIEKDVMSISIKSFMMEFQKNIENQVFKCWKKHWSQFMYEITSLQHELATLNETCPEDSDCSTLSSPTKSLQEEGTHEIKEEKSLAEEENENGSNFVAKMKKIHESIIRQKSEEVNMNKPGTVQEKKAFNSKKTKELNFLREKIHSVSERLENIINWNGRLSESFFNQIAIQDKEELPERRLSEVYEAGRVRKNVDAWGRLGEEVKEVSNARNISVLNVEKEYSSMRNSIFEDMYGSINDLVEEFESKSCNFEFEKLIQEGLYLSYLREMINEWNERIERNTIERKIRDDIDLIIFYRAVKDISYNQEFAMVKSHGGEAKEHCLQCSIFSNQLDKIRSNIDEDIREKIQHLVLAETFKDFVNIATSVLMDHIENTIHDTFHDQLSSIITEGIVKEDVTMVVFRAVLKEWKLDLENYQMENLIREKIHQVLFVETLNDASVLSMEFKQPVKDNITIDDDDSIMMRNQIQKFQGERNLTIVLLESLLSCFEAEENLMLSARSEIKEHSKQLDLGSERGDLYEHEIFEDLLTGEEQTFSSLTSKVEHLLQQLGISKALLRELGTSLGHRLRDSENFHYQMSTNVDVQLKLSSIFLPLFNLLPTFAEFDTMVCQKFKMMTMRYFTCD